MFAVPLFFVYADPITHLDCRHRGRANVLHCDGHVKPLRMVELRFPDWNDAFTITPGLWYG